MTHERDESHGSSTGHELVRPLSVLVADDDRLMRIRLEDLLGPGSGFELVGTAEDAEAALRLAAAYKPDAALVDVNMPNGGGPRVVKEISQRSPRTAVIILSVLDEHNLVLDLLRAGAMSYVVKGASAAEVLETVRRSIAARQALTAYKESGRRSTRSRPRSRRFSAT
jgi:two-component system, NarL family, response regulator LiaR